MGSEFFDGFLLVAVAGLGGFYLTSLICRRARKRVEWYVALLGTLASGLLTGFFVWLGFSLPRGDMGKGFELLDAALFVFCWACGCALLPALVTVYVFRRKSKRVQGQEEKVIGR